MNGMKCYECGGVLLSKKATMGNPHQYLLSGLSNVYLAGITTHRCEECREESAVIPKIEELHHLIFTTLIDLPLPLKGAELRFVRKYVKIQSQLFAQVLGIDRAHLSRFENGKTKSLGTSTERLARLHIKLVNSEGNLREFVEEMVTRVGKRVEKKVVRPTFTLVKNTWKVAA